MHDRWEHSLPGECARVERDLIQVVNNDVYPVLAQKCPQSSGREKIEV